MSAAELFGAALGLATSAGVLIAWRALPLVRSVRLADRIAPYLGDAPAPSRLLDRPSATAVPFVVVRRLFGPLLRDIVGVLERAVGGSAPVRRRLDGLGAHTTVEDFRLEQVIWGAAGVASVVGVAVVGGSMGADVDPVLVLLLAVSALLGGILGRDWWLSRQLARREQRMLAELPVLADLLALAVVAGESPVDALERVSRLIGGELARDLRRALAQTRAGTPVTTALTDLAARTTLEAFARFLQAIVVALERGTPLADVLRAQAVDVREVSKRALLEAGGRKEISMLVPVVFLLLPVTVLFALYPGLVTLTTIAH
jgi:tight adherence protein C